MKKRFGFLLFCACLCASTVGFAQQNPPPPPVGGNAGGPPPPPPPSGVPLDGGLSVLLIAGAALGSKYKKLKK